MIDQARLFADFTTEEIEEFRAYHRENVWIYRLFKQFATEMKNAGRNRYSAKSIMERIRWHCDINQHEHSEFKINNNYTAMYARLLVFKHPEFDGFFEFRRAGEAEAA